jgi:Zn-dependent protease
VHISQLTVIYFCALVVAIILHEISHGVVALLFGDDTARRAGRLTLNPIPHIDPFGSIIMPAIGALSGIPVIGWAKPVPVNPNRLRNQRRDMLIVSLAGPTTNLVLMFASALVARHLYRPLFGIRGLVIISEQPLAVQIAWAFAVVNLFLGLFNLLPIPPLDGAALLERVLPREWLPRWRAFQPYGVLLLLVLVLWGGTGKVLDPFFQHLNSYIFR